ncbi:MAG: zinc ribbon domain-containing protein [Lachnospiraceae bacterium]|nr:zinc ribbon domain-containing protein [Lachnospiraceae bacterium]
MALIKCSECGGKISDTDKACPHCGCKIRKKNRNRSLMVKTAIKVIVTMAVLLLIILGISEILYSNFGLSDIEKEQVVSLNNRIDDVVGQEVAGKTKKQLLSLKDQCQDIETEYIEFQQLQKRKVDNFEAVYEKISAIDAEITNIDQREIQNVVTIINNVGEVTVESRELIDNAKIAYEMLDEEQKSQVENFGRIEEYERNYDAARVNAVVNNINNIGRVSLNNDSEKIIKESERLYKELPDELKAGVSNYNILTNKRKKIDKKLKYKNSLLSAKDKIKNGYLNGANRALKGVPSKFKYKGIKASDLKKQLSSKSAWTAICGEWETTSGQKRVEQVWDYDGSSEWWYRNFDKGESTLYIKCRLLKNGKVRVEVRGSLPVYTSYSIIAEGVKSGSISLDKKKTMSSMGTIRIDKYTTLTLSPNGITVNYYEVSPNESQYFTYKYKSTMNFGKRVKKY